ncbi:hypothetical protein HYU09_03155 [Candidatus Woesearchaeota archaeon]|nr:hypothetical protein [Candidatus Woesearchaeota archaeon]
MIKNNKRKYRCYSVKDYELVMHLNQENGLSPKKIKAYLDLKDIVIPLQKIQAWIYKRQKPFCIKILKQIPDSAKELTKEKSYLLGVLCGDGYISTDYRLGLEVCDKEFADYFQYCLEKVYGQKCSRSTRIRIKARHFTVSLVSKNVVFDLQKYSQSFKSKEWVLPKQITDSTKENQAAFIRGFADSEAHVRFRKGQSEIILCSGMESSLKSIQELLKASFYIDSNYAKMKHGVSIIVMSNYNSLKLFDNSIGFVIDRKVYSLKKALESYKRKGLRRYSGEFKQKALDMLRQGLKHREIAKILGTSHSNIYDWEKSNDSASKEASFYVEVSGLKDI